MPDPSGRSKAGKVMLRSSDAAEVRNPSVTEFPSMLIAVKGSAIGCGWPWLVQMLDYEILCIRKYVMSDNADID